MVTCKQSMLNINNRSWKEDILADLRRFNDMWTISSKGQKRAILNLYFTRRFKSEPKFLQDIFKRMLIRAMELN